ncbi:carboxylesterase family protein, partial [Streptomyces sp. NPDC047081]|uniref:carboxylesterase family protein n=1 Tax=Streptomyces sp. NPDC047081 TaxID=3154706 RepID=UPI0033EF174F
MKGGTPRVEVAEGVLEGVTSDGVSCFLGVPYAAPPVGDLRFRAPRPAPSWTGVRSAAAYGPPAYQMTLANLKDVGALIGKRDPGVEGTFPVPPTFAQDAMPLDSSEDCLYLDIYVPPGAADAGPLPVYVYYHGGANVSNSAAAMHDIQRGENLARAENIIVVQPQYRVGALGWVHFGLVDETLEEAVNLGLQDQIAALKWISNNIGRFGGDPANITIGGESAGGTAVSHLVANPEARRYVRRAIMQSLSPFNTWCTQREPEARAVAEVYRQILGAQNLQTIDPDEFLALQSVMSRLFHPDTSVAWRPHGGVVDGKFIHDLPVLKLAADGLDDPDFEVMIGFAKDEW